MRSLLGLHHCFKSGPSLTHSYVNLFLSSLGSFLVVFRVEEGGKYKLFFIRELWKNKRFCLFFLWRDKQSILSNKPSSL